MNDEDSLNDGISNALWDVQFFEREVDDLDALERCTVDTEVELCYVSSSSIPQPPHKIADACTYSPLY